MKMYYKALKKSIFNSKKITHQAISKIAHFNEMILDTCVETLDSHK